MKKEHIVSYTLETLPKVSKKELERFHAIRDEDIDFSDIPPLDEEFWKNAKLVMPSKKKAVSLRIDLEVLEWFKKQGKGYQSLMNAVLKTYAEAAKNQRAPKRR